MPGVLCRVAVDGGLWGLALLLARQCGERPFHDTAAAMTDRLLARGTPLRTLAALIAGSPDLADASAPPQATGPGASKGACLNCSAGVLTERMCAILVALTVQFLWTTVS